MDLLLHQVPVVPSFLLQNIILGVKYLSVGKLKGFSLTENWFSKVGGKASFDSFSLLTVAHPVIPIGVVFPLSLLPTFCIHVRVSVSPFSINVANGRRAETQLDSLQTFSLGNCRYAFTEGYPAFLEAASRATEA